MVKVIWMPALLVILMKFADISLGLIFPSVSYKCCSTGACSFVFVAHEVGAFISYIANQVFITTHKCLYHVFPLVAIIEQYILLFFLK